MIDIETFVYFDLESTGLMKTRPKITELSCIAVSQKGLSGKGAYKYYVIRDGVGGGKGKDNTLITCPGQEGGGGR